jgi:glycine/D-amino acid oxidase-like deaminating enzyme
MSAWDVAIVGAGIVGAACASECARAGLSVIVFDRGPVGGGATAAAMGHIVVMDDSEPQFALTSYSRRLWRGLAPDLPAEVQFDSCGTLWVAADEEEMGEARRKYEFCRVRGVRAEILDEADLRKAEPSLRAGLRGGLFVLDDAVLYPPSAAHFLLGLAPPDRVEIRTGVEVRALKPDGGVVLGDGTRIRAGLMVNAAGCWSPGLTAGLPVKKRKGHLVVTDRYPGYVRRQIVELGYLKSAHSVSSDSVAFNVQPRPNGQMLIGSSRQYGADQPDVEFAILRRMLERAAAFLPEVDRLSALRAWTGFRPATPDKLPYIGPCPGNGKVWLATGHEGLGITTSLATGRLLADMILNRPVEIPVKPYSPARSLPGGNDHD